MRVFSLVQIAMNSDEKRRIESARARERRASEGELKLHGLQQRTGPPPPDARVAVMLEGGDERMTSLISGSSKPAKDNINIMAMLSKARDEYNKVQ